MVVRGAGPATAGDMVMLARLAARGIQTTLFSDATVTAAMVASMDLIVISSSAESAPLGTKLRDVAIPILCVENGQYRNQGMTGTSSGTNWGEETNQIAVTILPGASALVGSATGNVTLSRVAGPLGWGLPAAGAVKGATVVGNANRSAIFGYAKGGQMVGMVAPARRAGFAIREVLAANLTPDGIALFDAVLDWVLQ
jgi:hypothetical protein